MSGSNYLALFFLSNLKQQHCLLVLDFSVHVVDNVRAKLVYIPNRFIRKLLIS